VNVSNKILVAMATVLLSAGPAYPQNKDLLQLQSDVLRLQQQVNQLQQSVDQKTQTIQRLVEQMVDTVNGLNANVQKITQTVDSVNTRNDQNGAELRNLVNSMGQRMNDVVDAMAAMRSQLSGVSQQITAMSTTSESLPSAEETWRTAYVDHVAGNYDLAMRGFSEFQEKFPTDPRAAKAQIYKGDGLFAQKKYEQAVIEYDMFLQKYPQNEDTKTALLKKGLAQAESRDQGATTTLQQVVKQFPGTQEASNASAKLKELAAGQRGRRGP
jgi:TolA-binding protein